MILSSNDRPAPQLALPYQKAEYNHTGGYHVEVKQDTYAEDP